MASTTPTETTPDPRASSDGDPAALRSDAELDHLLVISGLSGAGKSQAGKVFEDLATRLSTTCRQRCSRISWLSVARIASDTDAQPSSSTSAPVTRRRRSSAQRRHSTETGPSSR